MHTEADVKGLWCPFSRQLAAMPGEGGGYNRDQLNDDTVVPSSCGCLASGCAAWRWVNKSSIPVGEIADLPPGKIGYCGLAGKP